jgi:hypothetical protein
MAVREERDRRADSIASPQGERLASAPGGAWRQQTRSSLSSWTDRHARSQTGRLRRALIALILIAATGVAATGGVIAYDLFWVDQAEQVRGLTDGE